MLATVEVRIKRGFGRAESALSTAGQYLAEYGLRILVLTCLGAALILLVWAHWAV